MKHLYIIGNGFDLHHGILSDYKNYRQWLEENHPNVLCLIDEYYDCPSTKWWGNFEENLGEKDIREYAKDVARENYPNFASDEFRDRDYHASEIVADAETFTVCSRISDTFGEWIESLPEPNENQKIWVEEDESFFINFNYTLTLEDTYHISPENILHIHGSISDSQYVLGHGKSLKDLRESSEQKIPEPPKDWEDEHSLSEWYEQFYDQFIEQAVDATVIRLADMQKDVERIIEANKDVFESMMDVETVHIYGSSFSSVDSGYLDKVCSCVKLDNVFWEISYYSKEDEEKAMEFITIHHIEKDKYRLIRLNDILLSNHFQLNLELE